MAAEALRCVWWFNPLAWMIRARPRRESEHAADGLRHYFLHPITRTEIKPAKSL